MAAPLSQFDEDWQDFNEFSPVADARLSRLDRINANMGDGGPEGFSDTDNCVSGETCRFESLEDLVHDFDERLTVCFRTHDTRTENIAPVKPITEDNLLKDDEIWNTLTDNYGNVMPVDWKTSHTRSLHLPTLNLCLQEKVDSVSLDVSDDEELREQMDLHSIIVSCVNEEPLFTAEQVIEEIEEIMQESPDPEEDERPSQSDLSVLSKELHTLSHATFTSSYEEREQGWGKDPDRQKKRNRKSDSLPRRGFQGPTPGAGVVFFTDSLVSGCKGWTSFERNLSVCAFVHICSEPSPAGLRGMGVCELEELLEEVEREIRRFSEELIEHLALRDELDFEKEVKNSFISVLIEVQNRQKEHREMAKRRRKGRTVTGTQRSDRTHVPGTYLTTVIPYEKKNGSPSVEDLQILTKILHAMREDSEKVPSLLTDYILKGNGTPLATIQGAPLTQGATLTYSPPVPPLCECLSISSSTFPGCVSFMSFHLLVLLRCPPSTLESVVNWLRCCD
ncbi:hypothetical protein P4O66_019854 [Electrophorus voltai]|uniref:Fasciculation and elongation protein zeta 2 (Zygin II) n=1 Tax=Electrophorus voltai TaxID=2609070 RepID=A0AAD8ZUQ4_9TELE|nr:hypothetical protein P4O66_019854 [Electrophorus voltai]